MDFNNRGAQPQSSGSNTNSFGPNKKDSKKWDNGKVFRISQMFLTACVAIVLLALLIFLGFGTNNNNDSKYVQTSKLQSVFLNTGQVYFGYIKNISASTVVLQDIYYLQTSGSGSSASTSATNVSLVKLGCELHAPIDQMLINRSQITFWENLSPTGQVAKAVATFEKSNPNGQKCTNSTSTSTTSPQSSTKSQ